MLQARWNRCENSSPEEENESWRFFPHHPPSYTHTHTHQSTPRHRRWTSSASTRMWVKFQGRRNVERSAPIES
jgi:hypothetical protein